MSASIITHVGKTNPEYLVVRTAHKIAILKFNDILFLEGNKNCTTFNTLDYSVKAGYNLKHYASIMPENFMRVHQSFIINLSHFVLYETEGFICLKGCPHTKIPLGRTSEVDFFTWLNTF
jgi:DNA-binding LytR/AlgR family response regulator